MTDTEHRAKVVEALAHAAALHDVAHYTAWLLANPEPVSATPAAAPTTPVTT